MEKPWKKCIKDVPRLLSRAGWRASNLLLAELTTVWSSKLVTVKIATQTGKLPVDVQEHTPLSDGGFASRAVPKTSTQNQVQSA